MGPGVTAAGHPLLRFGGGGVDPLARLPAALVGLPSAARALVLLGLSAAPSAPALILVTRGDGEAEALSGDLKAFARMMPGGDPERIVLFPALDADPYDGLSAHLGAVCARVRTLWRAATGAARIVVIPARSMLSPLPPPTLLRSWFVSASEGDRLALADDAGWLHAAGYRRADLVTEPGECSRRGGILDLYPPILDQPVRIELEGDTVVSLRHFSPADQRSTGRIERVEISPARETIVGPAERDRLRAALDAGRRLSPPLAALEQTGTIPGIEACARLLYDKVSDIRDWLDTTTGRPPLLVCDEPDLTLEELRQHRAELQRAAEAAGSGGGAGGLPPPDRLLLPTDRVETSLREAPLQTRHLAIEQEPASQGGLRERHITRFMASTMPSYRGRLDDLMELIRRDLDVGHAVCVLMKSEGRTHRMKSLLADSDLPSEEMNPRALSSAGSAPRAEGGADGPRVLVGTATLSAGFRLPEARLTVICEQEIFGEEARHRTRGALPVFTSDFRDLNPGDLVVHVDHGVGRYEGLSRVGSDGGEVDVMVLCYQGKDRLFVPVTRLDLVQKYSGAGGRVPALDKLGGTGWIKTKQKVRKAMQDMAAELLELYAARRAMSGHAFAADTDWQREFEAAFPYELTPDQQIAVNDIKRDLESSTPMDRLLCGDVGFGKTEVAMRASFKVVLEGKQVAVLAPTTVLVFQHLNTFRERFVAFPARIESLSRFKSPREQKVVVDGAATGAIDILIGTHRLLSKDVSFKDLGLLIVDEEQRFGVAHKERLKKLRKNVDVLTLTATPIPRTLQMSLMGVRDLSIIETPPENRLAIQTHLLPFKEPIIQSAIRHELARSGQVYYVHNRVETVYALAAELKGLVPEAEIGVAHGQMPERELEETMLRFLRGEFHLLASTTIIENGLDIPRVNTLIVNRADHFGLAQLYQLRGRIGRSDRQAYAYFLVPPESTLTEPARKRLKALQEFTDLGSGFRIAALDLEIRGAGNLLGPAQHGHIAALGFELYCRMLERAVADLKSGGQEAPEARAAINLGVDLKIPRDYIADEHHRLMFYKRIASASSSEDLGRIREEMEDRYGRLPRQGLNLLDLAGLRLLAEGLCVQQVDYRTGILALKFGEASPVDPDRILRFVRARPDATFSPPAVLRLRGDRSESERLAAAREALAALA